MISFFSMGKAQVGDNQKMWPMTTTHGHVMFRNSETLQAQGNQLTNLTSPEFAIMPII
jgi:hypothetical protein